MKPDSRVEGLVGRGEDGGAIFGILDGLLEAAAELANVAGKLAQPAALLLLEKLNNRLSGLMCSIE